MYGEWSDIAPQLLKVPPDQQSDPADPGQCWQVRGPEQLTAHPDPDLEGFLPGLDEMESPVPDEGGPGIGRDEHFLDMLSRLSVQGGLAEIADPLPAGRVGLTPGGIPVPADPFSDEPGHNGRILPGSPGPR